VAHQGSGDFGRAEPAHPLREESGPGVLEGECAHGEGGKPGAAAEARGVLGAPPVRERDRGGASCMGHGDQQDGDESGGAVRPQVRLFTDALLCGRMYYCMRLFVVNQVKIDRRSECFGDSVESIRPVAR
jgi:hypothetical protein